MLLVVSEIKHYYKNEGEDDFGHQKGGNKNEVKGNSISIIISCVILVLMLCFVLLTFISWIRNKDTVKIEETCKTRELYKETSRVPKKCLYEQHEREGDEAQNPENSIVVPFKIKIARLYYLLFLIKRIILLIIVVLIPSSSFAFKI